MSTLVNFRRGDRVKLHDGRIVELAWPFWWHGTLKKHQALGPDDRGKDKVQPVAWFVREIRDGFGGEERSEPFSLESDLEVSDVISQAPVGDDRDHAGEKQGADFDPLLAGPARATRLGRIA